MEIAKKLYWTFITLTFVAVCSSPAWAEDSWQFKSTWESPKYSGHPFYLFTAADLNKNGVKELVVADFGLTGGQQPRSDANFNRYNLFVLEWEKTGLKQLWRKNWNLNNVSGSVKRSKYFSAWKARQMLAFPFEDQIIVETVPPFLGLEWDKDKYVLHEQHRPRYVKLPVGSWTFKWASPYCYAVAYTSWGRKFAPPRECIIGIRDFHGNGKPKIVSILEEEIVTHKQYKQALRVRDYAPGFPIEWETPTPERLLVWGDFYKTNPIDRFNWQISKTLLLRQRAGPQMYLFRAKGPKYELIPIEAKGIQGTDEQFGGLTLMYSPDAYLRSTQRKGLEEYWGYHEVPVSVGDRKVYEAHIRRVILKADYSAFIAENIRFATHKDFIGVGYLIVEDVDDDGLDEVILVEQTGKRILHDEWTEYADVKDYIHILKWNGKAYQTMWVSPPYTKRGTQFLVEDIRGKGKKQLVVMSPHGTVQIWERQ